MITDTEARRIASAWHGGGGTALYAFASTGAIDTARADHNLYHEISDCIDELQRQAAEQIIKMPEYKRESTKLFRLQTYVRHHKQRGPVAGWADLSSSHERNDMDATTIRRIFSDAGLAYAVSNTGSADQYDTTDQYARQIIHELDKTLAQHRSLP